MRPTNIHPTIVKLMIPRALSCILAGWLLIPSAAAQESTKTKPWYTKKTQWHGHDQFHFRVAQRDAYLVVPENPQQGLPWIWRARFPGFHAEMDVDLVAKGFHLAYVDVAGLYGSPQAVTIGDQFYAALTKEHGLGSKPVLEGVSRGGLFVYNWAAKNPQRVSCIYCDTPVCDFHSWPRGRGHGIGSDRSWQQCLAAYELTTENADSYRNLPIYHAGVIAEAKIPLLHIVSENDRVVPSAENTYALRKSFAKLGHPMEIISVARGTEKSHGHHFQHPDPRQVVDFILKHSRR